MIKLNVNAIDFKTIINKHTKYVEDTGLKSFKEIYQNPSYTLGKKTFSVSNDDNSFLENLFGKTDDEVKLKLKDYCTNSNLETIISTFNKIYTQTYGQNFEADIHESAKKQKQNTSLQAVINILQKILNYNSFNDATTWNRHDFIHSLNLKVCPYCNRNYITSYKGKKNRYRTTADADHYFPKSIYPILQLNIYNMIPSCNVCNSKSKGNKDKRHLNPYKDENTNLRFSVSFDKIEDLYNFSEEDIQVKISPNNQTALNSIDVFNLDKIYEIHNDVVFELKNKIIASLAFKNASDYYNTILGEGLFDAPDWSSTWFDFLNKDPLKEPLVKLKQDIYYQIMSSIKK